MSKNGRMGRPRQLSDRALRLLLRIGDLQKTLKSGAIPVSSIIERSSVAEWNSLHVLMDRLLIAPAEPSSLRLTRSGWSVWGSRRSSH